MDLLTIFNQYGLSGLIIGCCFIVIYKLYLKYENSLQNLLNDFRTDINEKNQMIKEQQDTFTRTVEKITDNNTKILEQINIKINDIDKKVEKIEEVIDDVRYSAK